MRARLYADLLAFVRTACSHAAPSGSELPALPLYVREHIVGWLRPSFADRLRRWPHHFEVGDSFVAMRVQPDTPAARTAAMAEVTRELEREGVIRGWRNEPVSIAERHGAPEFLRVERAATRHFGFMAYASHMNVFTRVGGLAHAWMTAGLGGMGGAQPLAATMAGLSCLAVEVDPDRIDKRLRSGYVDERIDDLDAALARLERATAEGKPVSVALCANAADLYPRLVERRPDLVTEQTAAHDPLVGYVPQGLTLAEAALLRIRDSAGYVERARASMALEVQAMLDMKRAGAEVFDYGNNIREEAKRAGVKDAFEILGFVPAYIRPLFCRGKGPFRWVALSGDPEDIWITDEAVKAAVPDDPALHRWLDLAKTRVKFQGLPARICWLGYGERARAGLAFNELVRTGKVKAPIVIGRDHLDCGSVASPNRETEGMRDGSDAIADWPILNAMINTAAGGTWVSVHHGGGVGIGYSIHAGMVVVADGTPEAARRLERVLTTDPGMGVIRHADAGYEEALACAREEGIIVPRRTGTGT